VPIAHPPVISAPVFVPVPMAFTAVIAAHAVAPVTVVEHAAVDRTGCQDCKKYRRNEPVHFESFAN
jgi:hypothetical protein